MKMVTFTHPLKDDLVISGEQAEKLESLEKRMPSGWVRKSNEEESEEEELEGEDSKDSNIQNGVRNPTNKGNTRKKSNGKSSKNT